MFLHYDTEHNFLMKTVSPHELDTLISSLKPLFLSGEGRTVEVPVGGKVDPLQTRGRSRDIVVAITAG